MHPEVRDWVARFADARRISVLDIGGRDINGNVRDLFPKARFTVLDIAPGPGVDIVADASVWRSEKRYDIILCTEVFEHTADWRDICRTAFDLLKPGGLFVVTCAGPGRPEHSGVDGTWTLQPGEHYANVDIRDLREALIAAGFAGIMTEANTGYPCDSRAAASKSKE